MSAKQILFQAVPYDKTLLTLALESGVDGVIVPADQAESARGLSRTPVYTPEDFARVTLSAKADEEEAARLLAAGRRVVLAKGWEIIPVENLLAQSDDLAAEVESLDRARLAAGVLERGVKTLVVLPEAAADLKTIVSEIKMSQGRLDLTRAVVTEVKPAGLGHRVCVDTLSLLKTGQGMLVGNSSAFTFLVNAETEANEYVASRPFRVNAGAVHAYAQMPGDKTTYLGELKAGSEVLIVAADGSTTLATVGRVKVEIRPMLQITARAALADGSFKDGQAFLQNAETIRLVRSDGTPVSVAALAPGDEILCRLDQPGRHFGMRITEAIEEK